MLALYILNFQRKGNICLLIEDSAQNDFGDDNVIGGSKEIFLFFICTDYYYFDL
jgi:hypothetical protein